MPGPAPMFCPVLPEDFLRQARVEVRRKPGSDQSVQRSQLALLLQEELRWGQAEAGQHGGLSAGQVRRWRKRWAAGEFSVADKMGRGRKAEFSPSGPCTGKGRGRRTGGGQQAAPESPVPGRRTCPRPTGPGQTAQSQHGMADSRPCCDQAVAVSVLDFSA